MRKKIVIFTITLLGLGLIIGLTRDIFRLLRAGDRVELVEKKIRRLTEERQALLKRKAYVESGEFVEEEARNKLNMVKPGETLVILPPNVSQILGNNQEAPPVEIPNWKKWWKLFF